MIFEIFVQDSEFRYKILSCKNRKSLLTDIDYIICAEEIFFYVGCNMVANGHISKLLKWLKRY